MFRVDYGSAAEEFAQEHVPSAVNLRVIEMLRAIGDTAAEIDAGAGPMLGPDALNLTLAAESFVFHYTLDVRGRLITIFSIRPDAAPARPVVMGTDR